jgi:hypothetical protein
MNIDHSSVTKEGLKHYLKTSPDMFEHWHERNASNSTKDEARRLYDTNLDQIADELFEHFPDNFLAEQERSCDRSSEQWAVACFSERPDSILMWSHYCNHHRGMVIEFDSDHLPFNDPKSLVKVEYKNEKPVFIYRFGMEGFEEQFDRFAKQKYEEWGYEKEWRMIVPQRSLHKGQYAMLAPTAIKSVICGCRCTEAVRSTVFSLLRQPLLRHIRMFDAILHKREYKLEFVERLRS